MQLKLRWVEETMARNVQYHNAEAHRSPAEIALGLVAVLEGRAVALTFLEFQIFCALFYTGRVVHGDGDEGREP